MVDNPSSCTLCSSEPISVNLICCSTSSLLGVCCLTSHILSCTSTHCILSPSISSLSTPKNSLQSLPEHLRESLNPDSSRCLIYERQSNLYSYDARSKKLYILPRFPYMPDGDFLTASNGDIIISCTSYYGFKSVLCKYSYTTKRYYTLPYSIISDFQLSYLYCNDSIYMFGGSSMVNRFNERLIPARYAERFNLNTNKIEVLPQMVAGFYQKQCINIGSIIYIFDIETKIVQVFNTVSLKYSLISYYSKTDCEYIEDIVKTADKICIIYRQFIDIYDQKLNFMYSLNFSNRWGGFESYATDADGLIFFHPDNKMIQRLSLSEHPSISKPGSTHEYTRFIYTKSLKNSWIKVDIQTKTAISIKKKRTRIFNIYELYNQNIIQKSARLLKLLQLVAGKPCLMKKIQCYLPIQGMIQCNIYLYLFHRDGISRLNLQSMKLECLLDNLTIKERKHACYVVIDSRIYIIGGGVNEIDMYDIDRNLYRSTGISIGSLYAVALKVENKVYLVYGNRFKVMNTRLKIIEEGTTGWFDDEIMLRSNVEYYDNKIFFVNKTSGCLEYFDIVKKARGGEPIELNLSKI